MRTIDTHCHLTHVRLADRADEVVARARAAGVVGMVTVADGAADAAAAIALAERIEGLWAVAGIHPHNAADCSDAALADVERALGHPRMVALGETGLDYHYDFSPRPAQQAAFEAQLRLADRLGLPVVIHCREAVPDALALIDQVRGEGVAVRGVFHCFTGSADEARAVLAAGFAVSLAGVVTFKNSDALRAAAVAIPDDRLLVETDAPYLSPEPVRKVKTNEPAHVAHTLRFLARLRGRDEDELAEITSDNARRLFAL